MLIGHVGAVLAFMSFIISIMAYTYAKDAYEIEPFEQKCFYTLLGMSAVNILSIIFKDYSVMYFSDFLQFLLAAGVFVMTAKIAMLFKKLKAQGGNYEL